MKKTALTLAAALVLAACGSSQEASEGNFKKAVAQSGEGRDVCLPVALDVVMPDGSRPSAIRWLASRCCNTPTAISRAKR